MRSKARQQNRFLRIITYPARALGKARDFYVRSITSCSDNFGHGTLVMGMPSSNYSASLPRSYSANSSASTDVNDDLRELIRAASTRTSSDNIDINCLYLQQLIMKQQMSNSVAGPKSMPLRSCSVGMGKIDEENPSVFASEDNANNMKPKDAYPRSRSHAVNRRSVVFWSWSFSSRKVVRMRAMESFILHSFWILIHLKQFLLFSFCFSFSVSPFLYSVSSRLGCLYRKGFISKLPSFSHP